MYTVCCNTSSTSQSLKKPHLLSTTQAEHQVESGLLLDVIVSQGAAVLQLLAGKDQALLVWRNALLVLNLGLHILNGVRGLHLEGDSLASESPAEPLYGQPCASSIRKSLKRSVMEDSYMYQKPCWSCLSRQ